MRKLRAPSWVSPGVKNAALAAVAVVLVAGMVEGLSEAMRDNADDQVKPTPTVTVTVTETRTALPSLLPTARSSAEDGAVALTRAAIENAWKHQSSGDRDLVCQEWRTDSYTTLEAFMEEAGSATLDSVTVKTFFDSKCGKGG
jgi:hypothetical protein